MADIVGCRAVETSPSFLLISSINLVGDSDEIGSSMSSSLTPMEPTGSVDELDAAEDELEMAGEEDTGDVDNS
jgi:hypothetical protein